MIKGVIFDYGGTLDTAARHWSNVIWEGYVETQVPITKEQFLEAYVYAERELARNKHINPTDNFYQLLYKKVKIEIEQLIANEYLPHNNRIQYYIEQVAHYCDKVARTQIEKNKTILEELSKKYPLVIVSNFYGNIKTVLAEYGILHYFKNVIESAEVGIRKPSPEIFTLGVKALEMQPNQVLVIGDSYSKDIEPAQKAGCIPIWLKGESWQGKEEKITYQRTIYTLKELLQLVDKF